MISREPRDRRTQPLVVTPVYPDLHRAPTQRDEFGNLTRPQTLEPRVLAEKVRHESEKRFWQTLNMAPTTANPRLFGPPDQRRYEMGPVYQFEDRPELSAYTLLLDDLTTYGSKLLLVLLHDAQRQGGLFSSVRKGHVEFYSGIDSTPAYGVIVVTPQARGTGLAVHTELAWHSQLGKMGLRNGRPIEQKITNGNDRELFRLRTDLVGLSSEDPKADVLRERLAQIMTQEQKGWQHVWGDKGILGAVEGRLRIQPDPVLQPVTPGQRVILGKQMVHDPWSRREVLRPKVVAIEPSDESDRARAEQEIAELLENTKNRFGPKS